MREADKKHARRFARYVSRRFPALGVHQGHFGVLLTRPDRSTFLVRWGRFETMKNALESRV